LRSPTTYANPINDPRTNVAAMNTWHEITLSTAA
jgi:hypothetical protein